MTDHRSAPQRSGTFRLLGAIIVLAFGSCLTFAQGKLRFDPISGVVGSSVTATATGLEPGAQVNLAWESANARWNVNADGRFLGITASKTLTHVAEATVDAGGTATFDFRVPEDYGYTHNVFVVAGDASVARQGFTVVPNLTVSPTSGPVGTPMTVTLTGVGYSFWQLAWHLLYDGAQTGWLSAITTRGTATAVIPASGATGLHTLQVLSGTHPVPYLNQQQAPTYNPHVPTVLASSFDITEGAPVRPQAAELQSLPREPFVAAGAGASAGGTGEPTLTLDHGSGTVGSAIAVHGAGFPAGARVGLTWTTTRGNDIISGLVPATLELGSVVVASDGSFDTIVATPDDLGGSHTLVATAATATNPATATTTAATTTSHATTTTRATTTTPAATTAAAATVAANVAAQSEAVASYTITPSVVAVTPSVVAPAGDITITVKGVGWSDTANIYTFVMDNGYLGYGCGVNSQGDVTVHLKAPGQLGTHFIDVYPSIYRGVISAPGAPPPPRLEPGQDASLLPGANGTFFQLPMLNWRDHPGEELPAFHLAFEVR